jgi:hypothetical protein
MNIQLSHKRLTPRNSANNLLKKSLSRCSLCEFSVLHSTLAAITLTMDIDINTESLYPFPDEIIIEDRASATQYAHDILDQGPQERCLVIWVDASVAPHLPVKMVNTLCTAALAYLDYPSKSWREQVTFNTLLYGTAYSSEAELIAIYEAFRIACSCTDVFDRLVIL